MSLEQVSLIDESNAIVRASVALWKLALLCIHLEHFYPYTGTQAKCSCVHSGLHLATKGAKIASTAFLSPLFQSW